MKLTVLGSGTSVPHPDRASSAHWLETSAGSLLLDISADAAHRMAQERLDWPNLEAIWVSHFHLDHLGGLPKFLFGSKWAPQTQSRTKPLRIFGPEGLKRIMQTISESNHYPLFEQPFPIEILEVQSSEEFELLPGVIAHTFKTPHTEESLALRLSDDGAKSFVYTSDTGFSENLAGFAHGVDLLLMECSFRRNKPVDKHLELADAMKLAEMCNPRRVVLTHLYPEWDGIDLEAEARQLWAGETIAAYD
ncbi:MAG TPA: MBL fold metallo-hydrolase, partial [Pyrinomonadaceae bacterium]|nr:MBL fold metallo-hydrolase [Pyrinomonadaceae bacterium]